MPRYTVREYSENVAAFLEGRRDQEVTLGQIARRIRINKEKASKAVYYLRDRKGHVIETVQEGVFIWRRGPVGSDRMTGGEQPERVTRRIDQLDTPVRVTWPQFHGASATSTNLADAVQMVATSLARRESTEIVITVL